MKIRLPKSFPRETLLMALDSLRAHKFRSAVTVLGIVIGVLVAIVVASILTGLRANIVKMVEDYGTNNIYAFHLTTGPQVGERDQSERARKPLTPDDGEAIAQQASAVEAVGRPAIENCCWGRGVCDPNQIKKKNLPARDNTGDDPQNNQTFKTP